MVSEGSLPGGEVCGVTEGLQGTTEGDLSLAEVLLQRGEKLTPKDALEHFDGEKEVRGCLNSVMAIERQSAGRDYTMGMRMKLQPHSNCPVCGGTMQIVERIAGPVCQGAPHEATSSAIRSARAMAHIVDVVEACSSLFSAVSHCIPTHGQQWCQPQAQKPLHPHTNPIDPKGGCLQVAVSEAPRHRALMRQTFARERFRYTPKTSGQVIHLQGSICGLPMIQ